MEELKMITEDGGEFTFQIKNGKDGKDGKNGEDGKTIVNTIDIKPIVDSISVLEKAIKEQKFNSKDTEIIKELIQSSTNDNSDVVDAINSLAELLKENNKEDKEEKVEIDYTVKFNELMDTIVSSNQLRPGYNPSTPQIRNVAEEIINPATEEKQDAIITAINNVKIDTGDIDLNTDQIETKLDTQIAQTTALPTAFNDEALWLLRRMVKLMESNATVDSQNRQRVAIDNVASVLPTSYFATASQFNIPNPTAAQGGVPLYNGGVTYVQPVMTGPVDPRWAIIDQARLVSEQGIRSHLAFT